MGKGSKSKNMTLKANNDEKDEPSEDETSKFKSYITEQFKKFIKNVNVKENDKDWKQIGFSQYKSQDKFKKEPKEVGQNNNTLASPKCYGCQGYGHMKLKCATYIKLIGKSNVLATTLSDTKLEAEPEDSRRNS